MPFPHGYLTPMGLAKNIPLFRYRFGSRDWSNRIIYYWKWKWLVSNFIPTDSKKFGFRNFDWIIRFAIKNESEIEKFRSRDQWIVGKNRFWENEILTHNYVNTVSDKRYWTGPSDSECDLVPLTEVWWCRDYVIWRN